MFAGLQEYRTSGRMTVVEAAGNKIYLINGDYDNLKLPGPDLLIAEKNSELH